MAKRGRPKKEVAQEQKIEEQDREVWNDKYISEEETADITKLSISTLQRLRCGADGPPFYKAKRVWYNIDLVKDWMLRNTVSDHNVV